MSLFKKINGVISSTFKLDAANSGPLLKNTGGVLEVKNADDSAFQIIRGAQPVGDNDLVTKKFAESLFKPIIISRQADTSTAIPSNTATKGYVVVTTEGNGAVIGGLLYDDGSSTGLMQIVSPVEGGMIAVTDALTGGTAEFDPDSTYIWDADNTVWVKIGDIGSVSGPERVIRYTINNSATQDSSLAIPANARILYASLEITTAYPGGTTISIGNTSTADLIMATTDNDPIGGTDTWGVEQDTGWGGSASVVRTTIGGSPGSGAGVVIVKFSLPNG